MKNRNKFLMGILALGALAGCSRDDAEVKPVGPLGTDDAAYMSVQVALPTQNGTRTATGATGQEVGKDEENNVSTVLLVLAAPDDGYYAHGLVGGLSTKDVTGSKIVNARAKIGRTDIQGMYNMSSDDGDGTAKSEKIRIYVFCNPTQELLSKVGDLAVGDKTWVDEVCRVSQGGAGNEADRNLTIWAANSFLMSNATVAERAIPSKFSGWLKYTTEANPFELSGTNDGDVDNLTGRGPVEVERSMARFDFRDGSPGNNTYEISTMSGQNDGKLKVQLIRMGLVNMSKEFHYLRRVSDNGLKTGGNLAVCGAETTANYVVDTDAEFKHTANLSVKEAGNDVAKLKQHFNFPLYSDLGTIDDNTRTQWDNYLLDDVLGRGEDNTGWEWDGNTDPGDYHIWRYVTENTIPGDNSRQQNGLTTGVIFKGKLLAGEGLEDPETGHKKLFEAINGAYEAPKVKNPDTGAEEPAPVYTLIVEGKQFPILYLFQDCLYVGWNDEVSKAAVEAGLGSPLYTAAFTENEAGNPHELYQALVAAKGTDGEQTALTAFRAAAKKAGFTLYQASNDTAQAKGGPGYYFYYYAWNRHNDNRDNGVMGPMEFGVVRNNVYKLAVTKISRLGHPRITDNDPDPNDPDDPDEDGDVYLTLSVKVLPWTVRVNNFEF